ncbi:MAG TPA: plastocyanin/azurin family copper-binding protein [Saprospiraceae bacterium]|nr:plastocyanin/azurin family copper-binding protein [Saprospiraceae bacterium]
MKRLHYTILLAFMPFLTSGQAVITAIFDADLPGGLPKGTEVYITQDIPDLSLLGIGSANNGGGTNGIEFAFPAIAVDSGTYLYLASDSVSFAEFFGFNADYITVAMAINGDDAIELFWDSISIDVFGEIAVDGTGQPWEYTDGWAARKPMTGPDGSTFILQNWNFSGVGGLDMEITNESAQNPVPLKSYTDTMMMGGPDATVILQNLMFIPQDVSIEAGQTVRWTNVETTEEHNVNGQQSFFQCNPAGFFSGLASVGPWDYDVTFNNPGVYDYQCDPHFSHGMFGTVTVIDPDAPEYPLYDISLVHTEDASGNADSSGTVCEVQGVVHGPNFRPSGLQFTMIDVAAGAGINVFKNSQNCYQVTEGDLISVKGEITQFNGLTEIVPEQQIQVLSFGNPLMTQIDLNGSALSEEFESLLVSAVNLDVDSIVATGVSGWNLYASDFATQYLIRLDADVFADVAQYQGTIHVVGIVGQFDTEAPYTEGYQITPRSPQDIQVVVDVKVLSESAIRLSPNPAADKIYLETELIIQKIRLYASEGKLVYDRNYEDPLIDVSQLPVGAYVIVAETHEGRWTSRLIKG